jgi:hypothetical protein
MNFFAFLNDMFLLVYGKPSVANSFFFFAEDMSTLTPAQRLQFLEKARKKKEQPDNKVDVLGQLDISEGDRKKRKGGDTRISILVNTSVPSPAAGEGASAGGEVKSLVKKKSRTLSRKIKKDKDMMEVDRELLDVEDHTVGASPVGENVVARASQAGGASPWDPLFDPEAFLARMVNMAGDSARFNTTVSDELMRLALG